MSEYPISKRNKVKRSHLRGSYDHAAVHAILDAYPLCHVGYLVDGQPYVTPTFHWREGNRLYWHGSSASRMLRTVKQGTPVCLTVTLFDGFVMARSPFHHSANYRTAMCFGNASPLPYEAMEPALKIMMEQYFPGRWDSLRENYEQELKSTTVVSMEIEQASAKVRTGPPVDDEEDYDNVPAWAGVLPMATMVGTPIADPRLKDGTPVPDYLTDYKIG